MFSMKKIKKIYIFFKIRPNNKRGFVLIRIETRILQIINLFNNLFVVKNKVLKLK